MTRALRASTLLMALVWATCSAGALAQDTTFDDGAALAERLLAGVVRVHGQEHGFGLVVGADDTRLFVVTPQHVAGAAGAVSLRGCDPALASPVAAERVAGFDAGDDDLALLSLPRPAAYVLRPRALAPAPRVAVRDAAWLLGRDDACGVLPRSGAVAARADGRGLWRIDMPGVFGGSSGAPVATGRGIVALTTDSDNANITALGLERIAQRLREHGTRFGLIDARNEPPTDPQAAEQDLAEMLNLYLFKLRDAHAVLRVEKLARDDFRRTVGAYNESFERFRDAQFKYDGALNRHWQPEVASEWRALRMRIVAIHENFLSINDHARRIIETERVPTPVRDRMEALEPELRALQEANAQFVRSLSLRRIVDANPKP